MASGVEEVGESRASGTRPVGRAVQRGLAAAGGLPLVVLAATFAIRGPGANPVETVSHTTGDWALRFLWLSLAVTPARRWLGWNALASCRRTLGLLAFGYAVLHFATYLCLDLAFDFGALGEDLAKRPYIAAGFSAFVLLLPLAFTSTRASIRRLGRRWTSLHRLVYPAAIAAIVHYDWQVKADHREPAVYAAVLAVLFLARWPRRRDGLRSGRASE